MTFKQLYLEPDNKAFSDVMGNGKSYVIPPFQRDYSWEETQLEELWQDIEQMLEIRTQHFMGYLVFQSSDNKVFNVIDGQQRLTTISLFILAALATFKQKVTDGEDTNDNEQRQQAYHSTYMGVLDTVSLKTSPKLTLNRHNNDHFILMLQDYDIPRQRGITVTNRKLNKAFEFFKKKLDELHLPGDKLAEMLNDVCRGLVFTTITVKDDLNAYLVFETLNARGIHLSAPDLFKNYLLSTMAKSEQFSEEHFEDFENRWAGILKQLGEMNFTNFLRSHVGISESLPYKKELYRILKKEVADAANVIPYLNAIEKNAPIFAALQNHGDSFWSEYGNGKYIDAILHLETLNLFNVKTPLSLLMAAYSAYIDKPEYFVQILKWIAVISIRYNVICQKGAKEQEKIYNKLAIQLSSQPSVKPQDIKKSFKPVYPNDKEFQHAFCHKTMPSRQSNKKILFLLRAIEKHVSNGEEPSHNLTLEHVLPFRPDDTWQEYFGRMNYNDAIDRLGNLAIVPSSQNMAQEPFAQKRELLKKTSCHINHKIAEYEHWNIDNLNHYQQWLARQAISIWKINDLA